MNTWLERRRAACLPALALVAGLSFGCSDDVRNVEITEENRSALQQQIQSGRALTGEEVRLLDAYLERTDGTLPVGRTVAEVIAEQRRLEGPEETASDDAPAGPAARPAAADQGGARAPAATSASQPTPAPAPAPIVVASGTPIQVRLEQSLSSRSVRSGEAFEASLPEDLMVDGRLVAARGSVVTGRVRHAQASGKVKGLAQLSVALETLRVGDETYDLETNTLAFEARPTKGEDAKKVGIGAGAGAIIGAIAGGKKGAAIGVAAGAAAGTGAVLLTSGEEVELPVESLLNFELRAELTVKVGAGR